MPLPSAPDQEFKNTRLLEVLDSYLRYYAGGRSHTARAKQLDLNHFAAFLAGYHGYASPAKLKVCDWDFSAVQRFLDDSLEKGESPATVARRLATLKHIGQTLSQQIPGFANPAKAVKTPKVQVLRPKALSRKEIALIKQRAREWCKEKSSFIRLRNLTLFDFLLDTGIRVDEVRLLRRSQLDDGLEWIENVRTKGRRYRNVYITSSMRPALKEYLAAREKELLRFYARLGRREDRALPLFISNYAARPGEPDSFLMGNKTIWRAVNELSAGTPLHPHLLRHSYAIDLLEASSDVRLVAQALGHSDVRVTMRYTERKDEEIARALEESRKRGRA